MFDCGNSSGYVIKKERKRNSGHSVSSSVSHDYSEVRCRPHSSRRYNEHDLLCSLLEDLRHSGRVGYTEDRYRRYEKSYEAAKPSRIKCIREEPSMTFDGGTSLSEYATGPIIDLGSSSQHQGSSMARQDHCVNNIVHPGADTPCSDKVVFDGGTA